MTAGSTTSRARLRCSAGDRHVMGAVVRRECPTTRGSARLNIISHPLGSIEYKELPREKIKLPERQQPGGYRDPGLSAQVRRAEIPTSTAPLVAARGPNGLAGRRRTWRGPSPFAYTAPVAQRRPPFFSLPADPCILILPIDGARSRSCADSFTTRPAYHSATTPLWIRSGILTQATSVSVCLRRGFAGNAPGFDTCGRILRRHA